MRMARKHDVSTLRLSRAKCGVDRLLPPARELHADSTEAALQRRPDAGRSADLGRSDSNPLARTCNGVPDAAAAAVAEGAHLVDERFRHPTATDSAIAMATLRSCRSPATTEGDFVGAHKIGRRRQRSARACSAGRLSRKPRADGGRRPVLCEAFKQVGTRSAWVEARRARSGPCGGDLVSVELAEVVSHHQ